AVGRAVAPARAPGRRRSAPARHRAHAHAGLLRLVACGVMVALMADSAATMLALVALRTAPISQGVDLAELSWVSTTSTAALAALLAAAGRLADALGRRGVLAIGVAIFGIGAAAAICAPTWPILLAARLVQGVGAAMMFPSSLALLLSKLPAERRPGALAWWSASSGVGIVLVQTVGGGLLSSFGWRGLFLPSAVLSIVLLMAMPALPSSRAAGRRMPDVVGAMLLAGALAAAVLGLSRGTAWGWTSPQTLGCCAAAAALLAGALATSRRHPAAAIDLRLWRRPAVAWGGLASALYGAACYTVLAIGPLYLQHLGIPARQTGAWMIPISLALIVTSPLAARVGRRWGPNTVLHAGALAAGAACTILLADAHLTVWTMVAALLLGVSFGGLSAASATLATSSVQADEWGAAAGAVTTARMLGGTVGVAASTTLLEHPILPGPASGYASVLIGCLALAALIALGALIQLIRRTRPAPSVTDLDRSALDRSALDEVARLRRLVAELRVAFVNVRQQADTELAHLRSVDHARAHPRNRDAWSHL
ncbi:MFS transporter, partial [Nonomuraea sp. NPDC003707]